MFAVIMTHLHPIYMLMPQNDHIIHSEFGGETFVMSPLDDDQIFTA